MSATIIDGKAIAARMKDRIKGEVTELKEKGASICLNAIQIGDDAGSAVYIRSQRKASEGVGIEYRLSQFDKDISQKELGAAIRRLNQDPAVSGIILQMPVPDPLDARALQAMIDPHKDVEGISAASMGRIVFGRPILGPCTPMAIMELISSTGVDLYGKEAVMVGHSEIVGKPTALLLLEQFATTSVCHIATGERGRLPEHVGRAEILVVAVGKAHLVKGEWVRRDAIVIDVGINREEGGIVGDVEFDVARERASYITPVPGGVGPVTTAMLLKNTVCGARMRVTEKSL